MNTTFCGHCKEEVDYAVQIRPLPVPTDLGMETLWLESAYCLKCRRTLNIKEVRDRNRAFLHSDENVR